MINEDKALKLLNEVSLYKCENVDTAPHKDLCVAFRRAIEQREAADQKLADFRQEVSDAMRYIDTLYPFMPIDRDRFIISAPRKPDFDPLEEILSEIDHAAMWVDECAKEIRASLDARGLEIREKNDGQPNSN